MLRLAPRVDRLAAVLSARRTRRHCTPSSETSAAPPAEWTGGLACLVSARFAVLWTGFGYLTVPLCAELSESVGAGKLSLAAAASLQLPLELAKAAALRDLLTRSLPEQPLETLLPLEAGRLLSWPPAQSTLTCAAAPLLALALSASSSHHPTGHAAELSSVLGEGGLPALSLWLSACFAAPFTEELFFRGFLLQSLLQQRMPSQAAVALQAALFAAAHWGSSGGEFVQRFALGLLLGSAVTAEEGRRAGLAAPMLGHAAFNAVALAHLTAP